MNQFGMTNPCVNIAKAFDVPQVWVDEAMEWRLFEAGIRAERPLHAAKYVRADPSYYALEETLSLAIWAALDEVIADIKADAVSRRAGAAA